MIGDRTRAFLRKVRTALFCLTGLESRAGGGFLFPADRAFTMGIGFRGHLGRAYPGQRVGGVR